MSNTLNPAAEKPKFKLRKRHIKKALSIAIYAIVAIMMVLSMILPAIQY